MDQPSLSVIIVTWDRRNDLEQALLSLRRQDCVGMEIVVVDNGSRDGTLEMLRSGRLGELVLYAAPRNLGASAARNIGIRAAAGHFVAFMDSDAVALDPDLLSRLSAMLQADPRLGAVAPAIYADAQRRVPWLLGGYFAPGGHHDFARSTSEWENPEFLSTCFSLWRRDLLLELGGFDPAYPYIFEDCDLSVRARDAGWKLAVAHDLAVHHRISPDGRARPQDGWRHRLYTERVLSRHHAARLGVTRFLRRQAWWLSAEGRAERRRVFQNFPLTLWQRAVLFALVPASTILLYPFIRCHVRGSGHICRVTLETGRLEKVVPPGA